jgi:hypothetical protein
VTPLQKWLNGVIGGAIAVTANCFIAFGSAPDAFNPSNPGGGKHLAFLLIGNFGLGAALYLKDHPTPWSGVDRREGDTKGEQICPPPQ